MISRLFDLSDFTRSEKAAVIALAPFALVLGFAVGLLGAIYLITALPWMGA